MKTLALVNKRENGVVFYSEISTHDGSVMIEDYMSTERFNDACKDSDYGFKRITAKGVKTLIAKAAKRTAKVRKLLEKEIELSQEIDKETDNISYNNSTESYGCSYNDVRNQYSTPKLKRLNKEYKVTVNSINKIMNSCTEKAWDKEFGDVWEYEEEF